MKDFRARRWQQEDRNPMMTVFEKAGRYPDIIDLSIGDPDLKTPQKIIDLAFADAGAGHTKYTDPWGGPGASGGDCPVLRRRIRRGAG